MNAWESLCRETYPLPDMERSEDEPGETHGEDASQKLHETTELLVYEVVSKIDT